MDQEEFMRRLGAAIRQIRILKGEKTLSIGIRLKQTDHSTFARLERGELKSIDIITLLEICDFLEVSLFNLLMLAGVNALMHKNSILTWNDFYKSLESLEDETVKKLLEHLPPPPARFRPRLMQ